MIHSNTGVIISIDTGIFDSFKIKTEQEKRTVIHICKSVRNSFSLLLFLIYHQTNIFHLKKRNVDRYLLKYISKRDGSKENEKTYKGQPRQK